MHSIHNHMDSVATTPAAELLQLLESQGRLFESDRRHVETLATETNTPLDLALCNLGLISENELAKLYTVQFRFPRFQRGEDRSQGTNVDDALNETFLRRHRICPVIQKGQSPPVVAIVNPLDRTAVDGATFALGPDVQFKIATATEIEQLFAKHSTVSNENANEASVLDIDGDAAKLKDLASAEPAIRLLNRLIKNAGQARAQATLIRTPRA